MTTEDRGVFFDTRHYITKYMALRKAKQEEVDALKINRQTRDRAVGDLCDDAQDEVDLVDVRRLQNLKEELVRIDSLLARLNNGWDGNCVDCAKDGRNTSVVDRLDRGYPTCRCTSCRDAREKRARQHGAQLGLVYVY